MAINSVGTTTTYTTTGTSADTRVADRRKAGAAASAAAPPATVADHVAALDEQEPIRSVSATRGTLVDTYL
jgi:hypothetical protein